MATIINTKLGEHRGKKRIWLEGRKLAREGYIPGQKYDLELKDSKVVLTVKKEGRFTISRRERNGHVLPIIDVSSQDITALFDGVEKLRVYIKAGVIVISAHHQHADVIERVERLIDKVKNKKALSVCSLFHGGGVLDKAVHTGLSRAGIKSSISVAVEMESKFLDSSLTNNREMFTTDSFIIESPIQAINLGKNPPAVDIILGGIPCQGASIAGRSKNKIKLAEDHAEAGSMFFNFLQFVQVLKPAIVIIENVPSYANTASMSIIRSVLNSLQYEVKERELDGVEFGGALEKRNRLCVVAMSKGLEGFDLDSVPSLPKKHKSIDEVLDDIPKGSDRWKPYTYLANKEVRDKKQGKGFSRQLLTGKEAHLGTIGKWYSKARSTEPFILSPFDNSLSRLLTAQEHCAVKGCPESIIAGLSSTTAHELLGQGVVFPVFEQVAWALGESLKIKANNY